MNSSGHESTPRGAPILIVHLDPTIRKMMQEIFTLEGYVVHETGQADEALRILQTIEGAMIVYLEPLFLQVRGSERLQDFVNHRGPRTSLVLILLAVIANIQAVMEPLRADGYLALPFTVQTLLTSVEHAQGVALAKQASHTGLQNGRFTK